MEEIFFSAFFAVVFLGGSADCELLRMTDCDREYVYCYREDLYALCVDAEDLQIFWKFDVQCLLGVGCVQDNFPCSTPASPDLLAAQHLVKTNITSINNTNCDTEATQTATATTNTLNTTGNSTTTPILTIPTTTETSTETETTTTPGTTTTIGPPSCTNVSTSKGPNCQQYYECIAVWWWYESRLRTCSGGESYNATANGCSADATCVVQA